MEKFLPEFAAPDSSNISPNCSFLILTFVCFSTRNCKDKGLLKKMKKLLLKLIFLEINPRFTKIEINTTLLILKKRRFKSNKILVEF